MAAGAAEARLRTLASLISLASVVANLLRSAAFRRSFSSVFHPRSHPIRFALLALATALNIKSMPFSWTFRFFRICWYQIYFHRSRLPPPTARVTPHNENPSMETKLFLPILTTSMYTPLLECDYFGHKSNSAYFADLDMARTQLVSVLLRRGFIDSRFGFDGHIIAMGAVSCHFRRELKPYARFDIWTRLLSWDHKWMYLVSHMVKPGVVMPDSWVLQPWKKASSRAKKDLTETEWKNAIYATSISKYVVKKGRITVPPEQVLKNSDRLPPPPEKGTQDIEKPGWTWDLVEKERQRGLQVAEKFGALDNPLHNEFFPWGSATAVEVHTKSRSDGATQTIKLPAVEVLGQFRDPIL